MTSTNDMPPNRSE